MAILNENSTNYFHSFEPNTTDLTMAMDYNDAGQPAVRTISTTSSSTETGFSNSRYAYDAWDRPKTIIDQSLFSATWTYDIQSRVWEEWTYTEGSGWSPQVGFANAASEDHMLSVKSTTTAGGGCTIASKVHPKYQPNRGHLYSTALIHPNATDVGLTRFGLGSPKDACAFEIEGDGANWDMFAFRRYGGVTSNRTSIKAAILEKFPDFDPSKGHVYDIQFQWRGVGNYYYFVDLQLVYTEEVLGTRTELSMADPALQTFFSTYCTQSGTERVAKFGCVDVSSEGGNGHAKAFNSVSTGLDPVRIDNETSETAVLAIRVPRYVNYAGDPTHINSRGAVMDKLVTWCRDEARTGVYYFRDTGATNLEALTWTDISDSRMQYAIGGDASALQTAFNADKSNGYLVLGEWADLESKNVITNSSKEAEFTTTPGDILVITGASIGNNKDMYATLYFSEEI